MQYVCTSRYGMFERFANFYNLANRCEQIMLMAEPQFIKARSAEHLVACSLMCRCIDHFKAANSLIRSGLPFEAMTLVRGVFETTFVLAALVSRRVTVEELGADDLSSRVKLARDAQGLVSEAGNAEQLSRLVKFVELNEGGKGIQVWEMARLADMEVVYQSHYRFLSHFAAHPSLAATSAYVVDHPAGPTVARVESEAFTLHALETGCGAALTASSAFERSEAGTTEQINGAIRAALDEPEALTERFRAPRRGS